jgi:hypothetical protein
MMQMPEPAFTLVATWLSKAVDKLGITGSACFVHQAGDARISKQGHEALRW